MRGLSLYSLQKGQCNGGQGNTMTCTLPTFTSSANTLADISYSVVFGDAAGPNRMLAGLRLEYKPDPVFATDGTALMPTEFSPGSGAALTITVSLIHFLCHAIPQSVCCISNSGTKYWVSGKLCLCLRKPQTAFLSSPFLFPHNMIC